jgi:hypothetical protein
MIIVLIRWFIKPDDESVARFKTWWASTATIKDTSGLAGEFLSEPLAADTVEYACDDMRSPEGAYLPYVNVGLWRDEVAFHDQVAQYFSDGEPIQSFEAQRRARTILTPVEVRMGHWPISGLRA